MSEKYKQESKSIGDFRLRRPSTHDYFAATIVQKHEHTKAIEAPPPPPQYYEPPPPEVVETVTAKVIENPTEEDYARYGQHLSDHHSDHGSDHNAHGSHFSHHSQAQKSLAPSKVSNRGRSKSQSRSHHESSSRSVHESAHSSHHQHKGHSSRSSSSDTHKGAGDDEYAIEKRHHDHKPDELVLEHREKSRGPRSRRSKSHHRRARSSSSSSDTHKGEDEYAIEKRHRDHKPDELVLERRDKSRGPQSRKHKHYHHHHDESDDDEQVGIERRHGRRHDHDDSLVFKKRHHSRRPSRRERDDDYVYEERVEESGTIGGPLTLLSSNPNRRKDNHDINAEIRMLEDERYALKKERKIADREKDDDYEIVERRPRGTSNVRLGKDSRGRLKIVRSND